MSSSVSRPSVESCTTDDWELEKAMRDATSTHELYVLLARSECFKPLAYVSSTCVDTDCAGSRLLASTVGTFHERERATSSTASVTVSAALAVVCEPKRAEIVAVPAELASMRVLLTDDRKTTPGDDDSRLLWCVTSVVVPSVRDVLTCAVAWK